MVEMLQILLIGRAARDAPCHCCTEKEKSTSVERLLRLLSEDVALW